LIFILLLGFKNAGAKEITVSAAGTDATLKSIVLSTATTLVFATGPATYNYTTSVSPGTASLTVEPTTNDPLATVTVDGVLVASGSQSGSLTLNGIVTTTINLVVTASDGVTTNTYSIVVYETGSNDAFLSALSVSTGNTLVASATGSGNFNYTTSVAIGTSSLTVTPVTDDATASVTVNGSSVTSGSASGPISLNPAANATTTITVKVLAQDGVTTQIYSIVVTEAGSNNVTLSSLKLKEFIGGVGTNVVMTQTGATSYTASVKSTTSYVEVKPTSADGTASITVNGTAVASGVYSPSGQITVFPATISIIVLAQDGVTTQTYTITVSNNATPGANLSSIVLSANCTLVLGTVTATTINYSTDVNPNVSSLTVTPTLNTANSNGATITVNGTAVATGTASGAITLNAVGTPTTITIQVTSQDGLTTINNVITVNRNGSNNCSLSNLVLSSNTSLVTITGTSNVNYKTSVPSSVTSITVTPTAADVTDVPTTITVNGVSVTSGTASGAITLNAVGTTTPITIVVTAQDGTTQSTSITVYNTGSNNANVSTMTLVTNPVTVTPVLVLGTFTATTTNYSTSVSATVTSVTLSVTTSDAGATITYNGTAYSSPATLPSITLAAVGSVTNVTYTVTSPDGTVIKTWNIAISRNGSNNALINLPTLSSNTPLTFTTATATNTNYTTAVSPHTISLTVTAVTVDPNATMTINGLATASGSPSYPITLSNGTTTIVIQVVAQDGVTTRTTTIFVSRTGTLYAWTGATNTSYNNSGNWNPAKVPTAADVASFGETAFTGSQPTITANTSVGEMYFGSATATTLTINQGFALTISSNLTVDAGATAKLVSSATTASTVNILPGATVNVTSGGVLTIGQTSPSSRPVTLTLESNASGSASVGQITAGAIVGNVTVQRYITGGSAVYRGYRLLSSPVYQSTANGNNIYSLNYVQTVSLVTGLNNSGGFNAYGNPSLYLFNETVANINTSFTSGNYWGISDLTHAPNYYLNGLPTVYNIPVANGFMFFFRGDNINNVLNGAKYLPGTVAESVTMSTTGALNEGPITVHDWYEPTVSTLSYTTTVANGGDRGLHLIGNPYASSIDWDTYNSTTPGTGINVSTYTNTGGSIVPAVGSTIYILDPVSKNYGVYIANSSFGGTNNATHIIPSGAGFFIQSFDPTGSLTFNESAKTTAQVYGPNLLMGTPTQNVVSQYIHLKLLQDTTKADEIFISFKDNAQAKYVLNEDAAQIQGNGVASLASMSSDGVPLSINTLSLPAQSVSIPLNVNAVADGAYKLTMPEIESIPSIYGIWLMDAYKKDSVDFRNNPVYSFNISKSDAASYGSNRFTMVIRQNPALGVQLLNFDATKASDGAEVIWKTVNEQNYTNFTVERSTDGGVTFNVLGGFVSSALGTYSFLNIY